jgi:AcrR family transcriptional regulator
MLILMNKIVKKAGRRPGQSTSKASILSAAQTLFAETGYDQTTIRAVAKQAEVDPALVMHYFATKQELFIATMVPQQDIPIKIAKELAGDIQTLGLRLATIFISMQESKTTNRMVIGALRSIVSIPESTTLLQEVLVKPILKSFKASGKFDQPELRATLVQSQLVGVIMTRYILKVEPLASISTNKLIEYLAPTLQRYLTGNLNNVKESV